MNEFFSWAIPLAFIILSGAVGWLIKLAIDLTSLQKDNERQTDDIKGIGDRITKHEEWDRAAHKELFDSRNRDALTLERLTTLFEGMDKKIDEILDRERSRNGGPH